MTALVTLKGVVKRFPSSEHDVLSGVDLEISPGDRVAIVGPSGSGKSTLLFLMGLLDEPTRGVVEVDGRDAATLDDGERTAWRRERLGLVFQDHHLLPHATALENVLVPWYADGVPTPAQREAAVRALRGVGLGDRLQHRPAELSTGQRQRVALARALARAPALVLADEPTGAVDPSRATELVTLLRAGADDAGLVVVTHDPVVASAMDRVLRLDHGRLVEDRP